MAARDTRSAARIKRKPPPSFPYSPKYPLPDPSDPFAPLQVLRERAHSSQTPSYRNHSNSSLAPSPPATSESERFTVQLHADLPPPPRALVHATRSIEAFNHSEGYHSDNSRPPRPPRAKARPNRDSKSYFTDADVQSASQPNSRHHDQDHDPSERLSERQYHYRRRSQTLSFYPATLPQVPAPVADSGRPATKEENVIVESPDQLSSTSHLSQHNQYVYDDRQSHGHVYDHGHRPHPASTVDSHGHSHLQMSVHSGPTTPPMTPDDTMTMSSVSVRDRSESVLSMVPPPPPKHLIIEDETEHSTLEPGVFVAPEMSRIRTSEFPALLGKTEPDSPPPLPVPPPGAVPPYVESEPEQDYDVRRRNGSGSGDRRDSITKKLRRSSLLVRGRKVSDPSPLAPTWSMRLPAVRDSIFGSSSRPPSQPAPAAATTSATRHSVVPEVLRSGMSGEAADNRKRAKMSHRKSLSHVSLGVTPLPNVSFGPASSPMVQAENLSLASTLVGDPGGDACSEPTPSYLAHSQHDTLLQPQPQLPPPQHPSQTLARALELTPLPPKDAPLPPIRKDTRLPTPPQESSRPSAAVPVVNYERRRDTQHASTHIVVIDDTLPESSGHATFVRSRTPINGGRASPEMEMDEVVLMRSSRFLPSSEYEQEHSSPSPPLLANSLLVRPTSTSTAISLGALPPSVPLVSPAPMSSQINVPTISVTHTHPPARPELGQRRSSTPPPPPPRRRPSPPQAVLRRPPSPLPPPPRDELEPPTPAPMPLSPPRRMEADIDTPLPQPPLPSPPAPRTRTPPRVDERRDQYPPAPAPIPARPRSPYETRQRRSEERRSSEDRQERAAPPYLPVAQVRPPTQTQPEPQAKSDLTGPASRSRTRLAQSQAGSSSTPHNSVRQRRQGGQGPLQNSVAHTQLPFRPQPPPVQQHAPSRAQSPQPQPEHQTQTQSQHQVVAVIRTVPAPTRAKSPQPLVVTTRAQSPPPFRSHSPAIPATQQQQQQQQQSQQQFNTSTNRNRATPTPPPPPASSYTSHSHGHMQARAFHSELSSVDLDQREREREHGVATVTAQGYSKNGTMNSPPYAASSESTPLPLPNTPSTTFSHSRRTHGSAAVVHTSRRVRSSESERETGTPRSRATVPDIDKSGTRRHRRREEPLSPSSERTFDEHAELTKDQMQKAATLTVVAQNGLRVPFGDLVKERKTIVIFIRHFWCAMCQDYMYSISRNVDYEALRRVGMDMVVIGNGSPAMIKSYRRIFRTPIQLYTDPSLRLYAALGMTLYTNDPGPDADKGEYVRHGPIGGLAMVVRNALCVGMPVWEKGGDAMQLGGEFVIGPGYTCTYAHRMTSTRSHAPIREVLRAAGYHREMSSAGAGPGPESRHLSVDDEDQWMEARRQSLARMRAKREKRREMGTLGTPPAPLGLEMYEPELGYRYESDTGSGSASGGGSWTSSVEKEIGLVQARDRNRAHQARGEATVNASATRTGTRSKSKAVPVPASQSQAQVRKARRPSKGLVVSNPDEYEHDQPERPDYRKHHSSGRVHVARQEVEVNEWTGGTPAHTYIDQYGRRGDGYETEDGTVSYTYGQG